MANLIITIIAIALVAAAALMGAYYGGSAWNESSNQADLTAALNESSQVQMAGSLAKIKGVDFTTPATALSGANLLDSTVEGTWTVTANGATKDSFKADDSDAATACGALPTSGNVACTDGTATDGKITMTVTF